MTRLLGLVLHKCNSLVCRQQVLGLCQRAVQISLRGVLRHGVQHVVQLQMVWQRIVSGKSVVVIARVVLLMCHHLESTRSDRLVIRCFAWVRVKHGQRVSRELVDRASA